MKKICFLALLLFVLPFIAKPALAQERISEELEDYIDTYFNFYYRAQYKHAAELAEEAFIFIRKEYGADHPNTAAALNNLAALHKILKQYGKAEKEYIIAKGIYEEKLGPGNLYSLKINNTLGELQVELWQSTAAEKKFMETEAGLSALLGPNHPELARVMINLGRMREKQRRFEEAEAYFRRALEVIPQGHPNSIRALAALGQFYHRQKKDKEAEAAWRQAWDIFKWSFKRERPGLEGALNWLDAERRELWRKSNLPIYQRLTDLNDMYLSPFHPEAVKFLNLLPQLYLSQKRYAEADLLYDSELELMMNSLGQNHFLVAELLGSIAAFYQRTGDKEKAASYLQRAQSSRAKAEHAN